MTLPGFADRLAGLPAPATIAMSVRARALRAEGRDIISLALGEPDFATPLAAIEAANVAALAGQTKYPPIDGTPALKAAIARKFARDNDLTYAANEIMVSNGGKQVIFNAFMATLNPGDEVIVPAPYWVSYPLIARLFGGVPVEAPCREADDFRLRAETLEASITPRTRWLVLNFPNNPSGAICDTQTLLDIAEVLRRHPHIWVLSDEIYEHLTFGTDRHASIAAVAPDLKDRVLTLNGVSKAYAMTGWRVGFAGGPAALIKAMTSVQGNATSGVCSVAQAAATAALDGPADLIATMRDTYARRRDMVVGRLRAMPGLTCAMPDGAFYAYPGVAGLLGRASVSGRILHTDEDVALALLEEQGVSTVHGAAFGLSPYLRLSCATDEATLTQACDRIEVFVAGIR